MSVTEAQIKELREKLEAIRDIDRFYPTSSTRENEYRYLCLELLELLEKQEGDRSEEKP